MHEHRPSGAKDFGVVTILAVMLVAQKLKVKKTTLTIASSAFYNDRGESVTFGEKMLKARKAKKLTRAELAKQTKISASIIQAYENNWHEPSLSKAKTIAQLLEFEL